MKASRYLLGLILPPVGVYLTYGISVTLVINILLTIFGWIPGSIHAVWAISKFDEKLAERLDNERRAI
ncbi:MAG TPA: YqaE/Pmp3 family membrane protein [Stenomitos sp.]